MSSYRVSVDLTTKDVLPCWSLIKGIAGTRCIGLDAVLIGRPEYGSPAQVRWSLNIPLLDGRPRILRFKGQAEVSNASL